MSYERRSTVSDPFKPQNPPALAGSLFADALTQHKGNAAEASTHVIRFLTDALIFTIKAASGDNETVCKSLFKAVGEAIAIQGTPPPPAAPTRPTTGKP
jgi:hypothetical protein